MPPIWCPSLCFSVSSYASFDFTLKSHDLPRVILRLIIESGCKNIQPSHCHIPSWYRRYEIISITSFPYLFDFYHPWSWIPLYLILFYFIVIITHQRDLDFAHVMCIKCTNSLSMHKAVLVFTHSETLLRAAGVVHVMEDGVIVESGEYSTLKSLRGLTTWKKIELLKNLIIRDL